MAGRQEAVLNAPASAGQEWNSQTSCRRIGAFIHAGTLAQGHARYCTLGWHVSRIAPHQHHKPDLPPANRIATPATDPGGTHLPSATPAT